MGACYPPRALQRLQPVTGDHAPDELKALLTDARRNPTPGVSGRYTIIPRS
ncbi:hypothetical protein ABIB51_000185 [Arthrobacter sp. UYCu712]